MANYLTVMSGPRRFQVIQRRPGLEGRYSVMAETKTELHALQICAALNAYHPQLAELIPTVAGKRTDLP